ncbi:energy-coupling factor transporter transmembrane component T family protein [Brevibacillus daliensis]|uniref:energy-coupling factor transporter transmembrane component T family protein n=1 Tax=Brevibacillus daliensis TaxID=2892995 RepID=UPI001E5AECC1|nr:energy-coupling factor transporter transmembrane component T [Brevibacillus daliensis]
MSSPFELTRNITIGQYLVRNSIIHKLDPRFKLASFAILLVGIAICDSYIGNLIGLFLSIYLFHLASIPVSYGVSGLKPAIPFMIIIGLMQLFLYKEMSPDNVIYWQLGFLEVSSASIKIVIISVLRFMQIIFLSSILTLSTSTTEITRGLERLLSPLQKVKFPVHAFSLIITIAIRFVPTFAMEMEKMMKAQASRGAEFGTGAWWQIIKRTTEMFPLIIPLFNVALARGEDLILAMEARCYTPGSSRTVYTQYKANGNDYVALLVSVGIVFVLVFIPYPW